MNQTELGIDEAGRGPVLGPMVMAGVRVSQSDLLLLEEWGVKDSKLFGSSNRGQARRKELADRIMAAFSHELVVLTPETIDEYVREHALNRLEQNTAQGIISTLPADKVVLDGATLFKPLINNTVHAVNKADRSHFSVAAASILAKWKRDDLFKQLCQPFINSFGEIRGGGYANSQTLAFVEWHLKNRGGLPSFYRKSYNWKALKTN
jgi:ribonuclease HII